MSTLKDIPSGATHYSQSLYYKFIGGDLHFYHNGEWRFSAYAFEEFFLKHRLKPLSLEDIMDAYLEENT